MNLLGVLLVTGLGVITAIGSCIFLVGAVMKMVELLDGDTDER